MASEILKRDENHVPVAGFVTDDANQFIKMGRIDDTTKGLKVMLVGGVGAGTVTSITQGTGILLTPSPITTTGSVALSTALQPMATLAGNSLKVLRVNAGETAVEYATPNAGTVTAVSIATANGFSGSSSGGATPALTIVAGAIVPTSVNGLTITTTTGTLTIASGKILTISNTMTLAGGDSTSITFPNAAATMARTDAGQTFTGTNAFGVVTATSLNGNTFTTGTYTLTGQAGKTLTFNGSITLTGTDAQTYTFPTTTATIARTDAAQTFTGVQTTTQVLSTSNAITASGNAATVPVTSKINTVTNNSAATLTITLTTAGAIDGQPVIVRIKDFSGVAQTITWVNTENSTVTAPVLSNGSTTLPLTVGFMFNTATSLWRCVASS